MDGEQPAIEGSNGEQALGEKGLGPRRQRLRQALSGFDEAAVFTIHGFCLRMLQENAFESGVGFDTELMAAFEDAVADGADVISCSWGGADTMLEESVPGQVYQAAIDALDRALELRPAWPPAVGNRAIAEARLAALAPPDDDAGGTGGELQADEFVADTTGRTEKSQEQQVMEGSAATTDAELRALWLRRVQTRPADFLKVRFAQQLARQQRQGEQP